MPLCNRLIAIALGLTLFTPAALAQEPIPSTLEGDPIPGGGQQSGTAKGQEATTDQLDGATEIYPAINGVESSVRNIVSSGDSEKDKRQEQREVADLQAQEDMALWAERMFWASVSSIILTLLGLILIWRTMIYTKRAAEYAGEAVREARSAAEAAENSVRLMRKTSYLELRAYLSVEPDGIYQLIGNHDSIGRVCIRNVGRLPAKNVAVRVHMTHHDGRDISPSDRASKDDIKRTIHPGAFMHQGSDIYLPAKSICEPGYHVFVWGDVRYDDGFDNMRFTRFCHRYATASYNRGVDIATVPQESRVIIGADKARYHTNGNDAD